MTLRSRSLAVAALLAFAVVVGIQSLRSFDLFWHLAAGGWIASHRALPATDPFRFTSGAAPWIDHSWASQVAFHTIERVAGVEGLIVLQVSAVVLIAVLALVGIVRCGAPVPIAALLAALAIFGARPRFLLRPELATLIGLPILLLLLQSYRRQSTWKRIAMMVVLVAVWINLHPGALLAPLVSLAFLAGSRISRGGPLRSAHVPVPWWAVLTIPSLLAAAVLVNPAGPRIFSVPASIRSALAGLPVVNPEWMPAWEGPWLGLAWGTAGLVALVLWSAWRSRRIDASTGLVAALLGAFAASAIRHQGLFFVGAAFAAGEAAAPMFRGKASKRGHATDASFDSRHARAATWSTVAIATLLAAWCIVPPQGGIFRPRQPPLRAGFGLEPGLFPVAAARILEERRDIGLLYNDVAFGGYLIWRLYPERKVFLDGRNELNPDLLREVALARSREDAWSALLDRFGIDAAVVQYRSDRWRVVAPDEAGARASAGSDPSVDAGPVQSQERNRSHATASQLHFPRARFALIQWDDAGMLFLRRTAERAATLARDEFRLVHPEDPWPAIEAARSSPEALRAVLDELDRRDRRFGTCERSAWIRRELRRLY